MAEVNVEGGSVSIDTSSISTSANQTNGNQKTQIVDSGGEAVTVTGNKLDVNASIDTTGLATSTKQDTGNNSLSSIDGKITACNTGAVVISSGSVNATVTATDLDIRNLTSTDVVTVTGGAGQTSDVKVTLDSESVTVSGAVTANAGTNLNTSTLATEITLAKQLAFNAVTTIMYVDEPDANTTYQGWATASTLTSAASWMIRKISKSGNVTSILWCDGNQSYDNIWDNRAILSYS